jgi:hypothetical protein
LIEFNPFNDAAWSIVRAQRGSHPIWVFPDRRRRIATMNNTSWQQARREAGLHPRARSRSAPYLCMSPARGRCFGGRRAALLGHANQSMVGLCASADVGRLLCEANLVLTRQETRTVLRVANG